MENENIEGNQKELQIEGDSNESDFNLMQSAPWQNPGQLVFPQDSVFSNDIGKNVGGNLYEIKQRTKKAYNESPHVGSTVNRFSSWIWGDNSFVYSDYLPVQEFIESFVGDWFNDLETSFSEWVTNMLVDGESFPIITIRDIKANKITTGTIEDDSIRGTGISVAGVGLYSTRQNDTDRQFADDFASSPDEYGIITDPDDITVTAFYIVQSSSEERLIPDINIFHDPSIYARVKEKKPPGFDDSKTESAKWKGAGKSEFVSRTGTPFKQFIIPWKNMLGIKNLLRSVSVIRRAIESDNQYDQMIKYTIDFYKATMSYTDVFEFSEDRAGIQAFNWIVNKMKTKAGMEELYNTGITKPKAPGDTIITRPGMTYKKVAPQLTSSPMSGYFKDILNKLSAGMDFPADIVSSDSSSGTFASMKMSRQAPQLMVAFAQWRFEQYLRNRFFRSIFSIKSKLDSSFSDKVKVKQHFINQNTNKIEMIDRKIPVWDKSVLKFSFPDINLSNDEGSVKAMFGSKHLGSIDELNLSQEQGAKRLDIHDWSLQNRRRMDENELYGVKEIIKDKEALSEDNATKGRVSGATQKDSEEESVETSEQETSEHEGGITESEENSKG